MAKVLIIEDRRENIVFIANNILKPQGHHIITARDGETGLHKAIKEQPDLIITDLKLPRMNGLDVLEQLRRKSLNTPAIVMTFHGTEETAVRALRLGARDYLIKPFTFEEMQAALERALAPLPSSDQQVTQSEAKVAQMERELTKCRALLKQRDTQLRYLHKKMTTAEEKADLAESAQQAAAWEENNARLNGMLVQAKQALLKTRERSGLLEEALTAQKIQTLKHQKEARRLAGEMRNLSEAVRLLSQDMEHQLTRLTVLSPGNNKQGG